MTSSAVVRFGVRWTGPQRVILMVALAFFAALTLGWAFLTWNPAFAGGPSQRSALWGARALVVVFVAPSLLLLGIVRFDVWLDGDTVVRQGALWRRRVRLSAASFTMTETTWNYTRRFRTSSIGRITITAPTLVIRASPWHRIKLPLVPRAGHDVVNGRVAVIWLPQIQLNALADAIDRHAQAPNKATVANYLRNVSRSAVQPGAAIDGAF